MREMIRYKNRKVYCKQEMTYMTHQEIGDVIREGHDVEISCHVKKVDITAHVMTCIIEQNQQAALSRPVSKDLIKRILMSGGLTQYAYNLEQRIAQ